MIAFLTLAILFITYLQHKTQEKLSETESGLKKKEIELARAWEKNQQIEQDFNNLSRDIHYKAQNMAQELAHSILSKRFREKLPQIAIAKQFYIKSPSLQDRIEHSVRLTKEEFLLAFPDLYDDVFSGIDVRQKGQYAPNEAIIRNSNKIIELLNEPTNLITYKAEEHSSYTREVEKRDIANKNKPKRKTIEK